MPGERPVALREKPKTPVVKQSGERGSINITAQAVKETFVIGRQPAERRLAGALGGATQQPGELGVKITHAAVNETLGMAQKPGEQKAAAALGGTEQPTAKAKEGGLPKAEGTAFVASDQQAKITKLLDSKATRSATAASCTSQWSCC